MENLYLYLLIFSLLIYCLFLLEKYSIEIASIMVDDKELDKQNFFHNKILQYHEDSKVTNRINYILNLIFIISITYFAISINKVYPFYIKLLISLFSIFLIHIIAYFVSFIYPVQVFSILYFPYKFITTIFSPIVLLLRAIEALALKPINNSEKYILLTNEDRKKIISKLDKDNSIVNSDNLDKEDIEMMNSIIDLKDTTVKEVMIPRVKINAINIDDDFKTIISFINRFKHSRIPVYKDNIDNIQGVLYVKDLIKHFADKEFTWQKYIREAYYIPFSKKIDDLLTEFKTKKLHIAIVVDEFGGTAGLITMEDIIEEIVGEIDDEFDLEDKDIKKIGKDSYIIDGHVSIYDIEEQTDIRFNLPEDKPYESISGFIQDISDNIPNENYSIEKNGYKFIILKKDGPKIEKIKVVKIGDKE